MVVPLLILTFLLLLNGFFAMAELAMMTSRQSRLQQSAKAGSRGAAAAVALAREPTRFLSTVQVGITLIGIFAGAFGENAISEQIEPLIARSTVLKPYADTIALVVVVLLITYGLLSGSDFKVSAVMQKPVFVPESMPALRLLDQFQSTRSHIAFVIDEYGGTQGLVTLNDLTSAIVGDLSRKGEAGHPSIIRRGEREWIVDGRLPLHDLIAHFDLPAETEDELPDVSTVAGLVMALLRHIPREGEVLAWEGFAIEVIDMDGSRIDKLIVTRAEVSEPG